MRRGGRWSSETIREKKGMKKELRKGREIVSWRKCEEGERGW